MVHSVSTKVTVMAAGSSRVSEVVFESISEEPHPHKAIIFPRDHLERKIQFFVVFNRNGSPNFHSFESFEAVENLSSCNHEAGSSKLPDASSCAQRQNR